MDEALPHGFGTTVTVLFAEFDGAAPEGDSPLNREARTHGAQGVRAVHGGRAATFHSARAGTRCAVAVQRALAAGPATHVRVRMGLHTGELAGDDLHGPTVAKAARIAALARAGEVLASRVVRDLAGGDRELDDDIWFDDERDVELSGLPGRHSVVAVRWRRADARPLSVVIADDSAVVRDGVAAVLRDSGIDVMATAHDAESLYAAIDRHRPDVAIVDIRMPPSRTNEGLVAAERLARSHPDVGVLVLSQHLELGYALQLVHDGAERRGYLLKDRVADIDTLLDAVRRVARGGCVIDQAIAERLVDQASASRPLEQLTDREREVLRLIAQGLSNQAIAEQLVVTLKTVETHIGQIFMKLDLRRDGGEDRRVAAVLTYLRAASTS